MEHRDVIELAETPIDGLLIAKSRTVGDKRGSFARVFCANELQPALGERTVKQANISRTSGVGTVRGMHFQRPPAAELKIVRCIAGRVFDVAVDLRKNSPTFLRWHGVELTPENNETFVIPEGFAHGFQVLEEDSQLLYFHTEFYRPDVEGGIRFDDQRVGISWPLPPIQLSDRDMSHPLIPTDFEGLSL